MKLGQNVLTLLPSLGAWEDLRQRHETVSTSQRVGVQANRECSLRSA